MCTRLAITTAKEAMAQLFEATPFNDLPDVPDYNQCPTDRLFVVTSEGGTRQLQGIRWGFVPHWYKGLKDGPLILHARAETVAEKPAFRAAIRERRCLVLASGYYDWAAADGAKVPWYAHRTNGAVMALAALWQDWTSPAGEMLRTLAVVTCEPKGALTAIHHRAPVVIEPEDAALWLGESGKGAAKLMVAPDDRLTFHRVGPAIASVRAEGPELIEPLA